MLEINQDQWIRLLDNVNQLNSDYTSLSISLAVLSEKVANIEKLGWFLIFTSLALVIERAWKNIMYYKRNNK